MKRIKIAVVCAIFAAAFLVPEIVLADAIDKSVGVGAAVVTHEHLKAQAKEKKKNGEPRTFAERHPVITSVGVGAAANQASHEARDKKKKKNKKDR